MLPLFLKSDAKVQLCPHTYKFLSQKYPYSGLFLMCVKLTLILAPMQSFASFFGQYLRRWRTTGGIYS